MLSHIQLNEEFLTSLLAYQKMVFSRLFHVAVNLYVALRSALFVDVSDLIVAEIALDHASLNHLQQLSSFYVQIYIHLQPYLVADRLGSDAAWNFQSGLNVPFPLRLHAIEASCLDHGNAGMPCADGGVSHP